MTSTAVHAIASDGSSRCPDNVLECAEHVVRLNAALRRLGAKPLDNRMRVLAFVELGRRRKDGECPHSLDVAPT